MTTIRNIETRLFRVPLPEVMTDAKHGDHHHFELVTVTIELDDGSSGTGYTYTGGKGGRAIKSTLKFDMAPALIGKPGEPGEISDFLEWHMHYVGRGGIVAFAVSAVDIALWDLRCKQAGLPLWKMAGGHADRCDAYRGGIDLNYSDEKLLDSIRGYLAQGYKAVKIKVGRDSLAEDVERVRAVRELIGPDTPFMVDANYSMNIDEAIEAARGVQRLRHRLVRRTHATGRLRRLRENHRGHRRAAGHGRKPPHHARVRVRLRSLEAFIHPARRVELRRHHRLAERGENGQGAGHPGLFARHAGAAREPGLSPGKRRLAGSPQLPHRRVHQTPPGDRRRPRRGPE